MYIDSLTYEQFMMLGDAELSRRFSMQDEAEQKAKIDREQANELEYVDESQKSDAAESANASNGSAGAKPVRNPEREKPKWEDTITNRMLHWSYTPEQKEEVKKAQEEQDALTAEAEANSKKFAELIQDYTGLISVVQDQIDGINGGVVTGTGSVVTVESVLNYWKNQVATQEKSVEEAKQKVTAAEKSIELFNKGEYKEAYVIEQKKLALETAQEAYDVAKAIYDTALAQVKAVLETLSK